MPKPITFYDTMTGSKRLFEPLIPGTAKVYSCGPTVYDYAHIGNFRNFVFVDILRRTLQSFGYRMVHVMNITDIDDKIIRDAAGEGIPTTELTRRYEKAFFEDCRFLKLEPAEYFPRATEHIEEMVDLVVRLQDKGLTYRAEGSIYFRIAGYRDYGKLSRIDLSGIKSGARVDSDEYDKESLRDFVLWKGHREGEPSWDTRIGKGRPGWHLECSAMSHKYLGDTFDIHTGAEDLIFPHHENEIAQSRAAYGGEFVRYWLHCAFLNMKAQKMSKSLGNIVTIHELAESGINPRAIRYFLLSSHYRKPLVFAEESIEASRSAVERLEGLVRRIRDIHKSGVIKSGPHAGRITEKARETFYQGMQDDLNTSKAMGGIFEMVREINPLVESQDLGAADAEAVLVLLKEVNRIIDVLDFSDEILPGEIEKLIEKRQEARRNRDFKMADQIRDDLRSDGIILEDTSEGVRWRRI
ncbi:cysteine--tRNA ligase [bacterium]|nr:cysteine--tRNA ligase [candidate division CSSED10-310 bacterium]